MGTKHKKDVGAIVHKDGVSFRVWAPFANAVAVTGSFNDWQETPMASEKDGYWFVDVPGAEAGQEYRYQITNGEQHLFKNDPRALAVTTAAGNSVIVDTAFEWDDAGFTPATFDKQIIYEMHVGTFFRPDPSTIGTFADVREKLDYLVDLGITTIELMPISTMSAKREWWGYTPMYIYTVETLYGGRKQFLEFVNEAHKRGISVILDVVYNHLGPADLDIWQFDGWSHDGKGGIYFYNDWRSKTPWGETRPDFGRQEVQQYILDNVAMWMNDCHLDGLRVDSTIFIRNAEGHNDDPGSDLAEGWYLLQHINELARKINPGAFTVAEDVGANHYITKPTSEGGAGFYAQWELNFPKVLRDALWTSDPWHLDLNGVCEELGRSYNGDPLQRVIYTDSHDTAANGSARLNEIIAPGKADNLFARKQELIAATLLLTAPGIPMLFQGQEFMEGGAFSDWRALDWEMAERHKGIILAHKDLIALRKNASGVTGGLAGRSLNLMHVDNDNKVIAYHRWQDGGPHDDVVVIINFSDHQYDTYELWFPRPGTWKVRFNSTWKGYSDDFKDVHVSDVEVSNGSGTLLIPPSSALILSQGD
jgi:1,4-alpha-glucan branching enzyme